jgi:hypothetical protein
MPYFKKMRSHSLPISPRPMLPRSIWPILRAAVVACASFFSFATIVDAASRPIPTVVNIKAFAAADRDHLDLLIRLPLASVKNVQFPIRDSLGHLDVAALQSMQDGIARNWVADTLEVTEQGAKLPKPAVLGTRISISSDASFGSYSSALARFAAHDLKVDEEVLWQQVWLDVHLRYAAEKSTALSVEPHVAGLGVKVTTDFVVVSNGEERTLTFDGDPGRIHLNPQWHNTLAQFLAHGVRAVMRNADFVVFLFCLALPFKHFRTVWPATAAFAGAVALGFLSLRLGLIARSLWIQTCVDALVAASIVAIAASNVIDRVTARRRASFALIAGIVFGLSSAFRFDAIGQFAADHPLSGEIGYLIGIALSVALAVAIFVPLARLLFSFARAETLERIIVSALAADTAWSWFMERGSQFARIPFSYELDGESWSDILSGIALVAIVSGLIWALDRWLKLHGFADEPSRSESKSAT